MSFDPIFAMAMSTLCITLGFAVKEIIQVRSRPRAVPVRIRRDRQRR